MSEAQKVTNRRERNRLAAASCRQRKIDKQNELKGTLKELKKVHGSLVAKCARLTKELETLSTAA